MLQEHSPLSDLIPRDISLSKLPEKDLDFLEESLQAYVIELARKDPNVFIALHFGKPQHPMHKDWQRLLSKHQRVMVAAMRGSGKSTQISVLRCLWELGNRPDLQIKLISVREDRAQKNLGGIARHITDCPAGVCQLVFPNLRPDPTRSWASTKINIVRPPGTMDSGDSSVEAWEITSSPEGGRAHLMVFDDITSYQTSIVEERKRESIKEAFNGTWLDVKAGPASKIWYLCTLWHKSDCSYDLIHKPGWKSKVYLISDDFERVETNEGDSFPFPIPTAEGSWGKEEYINEYKVRGPFRFNRSYRNRPVDDATRLFKSWMLYGNEKQRGAIRYGIPPWDQRFSEYPKYCGVDLGIGKERHNKPSVVVTIAVSNGFHGIPRGTRIVLDIRRGKWTSPDTARQLVAVYDEYRPEIIKVENNYYQQALIDWLKDLEGISLPIEAHFTGSQKMDLDQGIPLLASEFERGMWIIPLQTEHSDECSCNVCLLVRELLDWYPGASSTDLVMSAWMAQRAAKMVEGFSGGFAVFEL